MKRNEACRIEEKQSYHKNTRMLNASDYQSLTRVFWYIKKKDWGEGSLDFVFSTVAVEANQDRKSTRSCNYKFLHANYMKKCKWWEGKLRSINHTWGHVPSSKKIQPNTLVVHLDRTTQQSMFIVTLQKTKGDNWLKYRIISLQSQENF